MCKENIDTFEKDFSIYAKEESENEKLVKDNIVSCIMSAPHLNKPTVVNIKCCYCVLMVGTVILKCVWLLYNQVFSQRKF